MDFSSFLETCSSNFGLEFTMHVYVIGGTLHLATLMTQTRSSTQPHPHDTDLQVSWRASQQKECCL